MSLSDLSPIVGDLSVGALSGFAIGYFSKRFLKFVAFVLGGYMASLMYLESRNYLSVNWDTIFSSADSGLNRISQISLSASTMSAGIVSGLYLGWRSA